jgi:RNA polymerase sigma-70 factor (ECF subfamily)
LTEAEIIERILAGETQVFAVLVGQYQRKALSLAERMMQDSEEARDLVQDAFVKAYRSLGSFKGDSTFSTWFYRIVYTTCLNALDKRKRTPVHDVIDEETSPVWVNPRVFVDLERKQIDEVLHEELRNMPSVYSTIMELFYIDDFSYEEIVNITGLPLGTVKTRLNRGRQQLRAALLKRLPDAENLYET